MRSLLVFFSLVAALPALAQTTSTSTSQSNSNAGSSAVVNQTSPSRLRSRVDSTASSISPGLAAAGVNSCSGSTSGGVGVTGFNFGFGQTHEQIECTRRAYAASLMALGQNAAAFDLLCQNPEVRVAVNATGGVCPSQKAEFIAARQRAETTGQMAVHYVDAPAPQRVAAVAKRQPVKHAKRKTAKQAQVAQVQ